MIRKVKSAVAAGLSGFFAPYITDKLETTGAIGGGLGIDKAVTAEISVDLDYDNGVLVVNNINGIEVESCLAQYIVEKIFGISGLDSGWIRINQTISVPIGGGYGTSGGSALAISSAMARALNLPLDLYTIAEVAHEADIVCKTGLGTVVGIMRPCNGIVLVVEPGGPRHARVVCIPLDSSIIGLTAFYRPIPKSAVLSSLSDLSKIKEIGFEILRKIEREPTPETFIENCYRFAIESGLMTPTVKNAIELLNKVEGALGSSMNMIGEALFALIDRNAVEKALEIVKTTKPSWIWVWKPSISGVHIETP